MPEERKTDTLDIESQIFHRDNGVRREHDLVVTAEFARKLKSELDEARLEAKSKGIVLDAISDELESVTGKSLPLGELVGEIIQQRDTYRAALEKILDIDEESDCIYAARDQIVSIAHNALNGHE
jgi:hypothetical protein